jgi:hypothetical protein
MLKCGGSPAVGSRIVTASRNKGALLAGSLEVFLEGSGVLNR